MPTFKYTAKKGPKDIIEGEILAENEDIAITKITQMGYVPVRITEQKISEQPEAKKSISVRLFGHKVKTRDIDIFTRQLATLLKSRVVLLRSLGILFDQTTNLKLKEMIAVFQADVKDGRMLSESLAKFPKCFPQVYINMVRSGETGGVLDNVLLRLADFREKEHQFRSKVQTAMAYPIMMLIVGFGTVFALVTFVMPRIMSMFSGMGKELPLPTKMLIFSHKLVVTYWYVPVVIAVFIFFMFKRTAINPKEKRKIDAFKLSLPAFGNFIRQTEIAAFSRTLAILLNNGIGVFQAISITAPTVKNLVLREELERVSKDVVDGSSISNSMKKTKLFPPFVTNMVAVGEESGKLGNSLMDVADLYEKEVDQTVKVITSLLEPVMILVLGLIVGFIVVAMLMPIFQIDIT